MVSEYQHDQTINKVSIRFRMIRNSCCLSPESWSALHIQLNHHKNSILNHVWAANTSICEENKKVSLYLFIHLNACCSKSMEIKPGRNGTIPCVVHHGNIFHHLYAKNHLLEEEECNKPMQGVCGRMRTTCFYLNSPTIVLGNTSRCPFFHLRRTKMQLRPLFYRHGWDLEESPSPKVSRL